MATIVEGEEGDKLYRFGNALFGMFTDGERKKYSDVNQPYYGW